MQGEDRQVFGKGFGGDGRCLTLHCFYCSLFGKLSSLLWVHFLVHDLLPPLVVMNDVALYPGVSLSGYNLCFLITRTLFNAIRVQLMTAIRHVSVLYLISIISCGY